MRDHTTWKPIDTAKAGYGYTVSASGVQIVTAYSAIANGGALMQAHLISKIKYPSGKEDILATPMRVREVLKPNTIESLKKMLISVVENGTAKAAQMPAYKVAGKTGTAQVGNKTNGWFAGFAPYDDPEIAIVVVVENVTHGGYTAEVARDIFAEYFGMNASKIVESQEAVSSEQQVR